MRIDWKRFPKLIGLSEVSDILHIHPNTLRNWDEEGKFKAVRIGPRQDRRYEKEKVAALYQKLSQEQTAVNKKTLFLKWGFSFAIVFLLLAGGLTSFFLLRNRDDENKTISEVAVQISGAEKEQVLGVKDVDTKEKQILGETPAVNVNQEVAAETDAVNQGKVAGVSEEGEKQILGGDEQTKESAGKELKEKIKIPPTYKGLSVGYFFALASLFFGGLFFLYSLKYYFTVAVVLGFSRNGYGIGNGNGNSNGNGNGNGHGKADFFYRLFFGNGNGNGNGHSKGNNGDQSYLSQSISRLSSFLTQRGSGNGNRNGNGNGNGNNGTNGAGMWWALDQVLLEKEPFISVHLPFYNERKVVNRILTACTSFEYKNYEVIVVDDSNDETVEILEKWKKHPKVKVIHRETRDGFKGAALQQALEIMNPRTEFIAIFDADFVPYPDTLTQFVKYFHINSDNGNGENNPNDYTKNNLAAVQGYQWHVLNKNENWITRAVRSEFAGSYVVERPGAEIIGSLKMIAGSVYMIRADVMKKYGWGTSITEDFELTLRLYADGYRVMYTPYIQGPSECVSTLKRLVRQRMRWAEGHTHNIRKYMKKILFSPYLRKREKLEFLYLAPYYLQACFFVIGTLCWFISDAVLHANLPFWTALWGWSLVFTNMFALPLVNAVGLFLEESENHDYSGLFAFVILSYVLVPFQAYASIKGLLGKKEDTWFRTPKSGHITDTFFRARFRRWFGGLFPGLSKSSPTPEKAGGLSYLKRPSANNQFNSYKILPRRKAAFAIKNIIILFLVLSSALLIYFSNKIDTFYFPGNGSRFSLKSVERIIAEQENQEGNDYSFFGGSQDEANSLVEDGGQKQATGETAIEQAVSPISAINKGESQGATPKNMSDPSVSDPVSNPPTSGASAPREIADAKPIDNPVLMIRNTIKEGGKEPEFIFHPEPRVRIKQENYELELKTLASDGLGKMINRDIGYNNSGQSFYPEIFADVDLRYSVIEQGLLEEFILNKPKGVSSITQELNLYEVEMIATPDNQVVFVDKHTKEEKFRFDIPKMYELGDPEQISNGLHYILTETGSNQYQIDIVIDETGKTWLAAPGRQYPVAIDPSIIITGNIIDADVDFGGQQQKLVYLNSAYYAFYNDGGRIAYAKCTDNCNVDGAFDLLALMSDGADTDNEGPDTFVDGNYIWVAWFDNSDDNIVFQSINTGSMDALGSSTCASADMGNVASSGVVSISKGSNGDFLVTYDDDPDTYEVTGVDANCSGVETFTARTFGEGAGDKQVQVVTGNIVHIVWQEESTTGLRHNYFDVSTSGAGTEVAIDTGNVSTSFGLTLDNDGDLFVHAKDGTNTTLYECTAPCTDAGRSWSDRGNVYSGATGAYATITNATSDDKLVLSYIQGAAGSAEQAYFKTTAPDSISLSSEYSYGFTGADAAHIASMRTVANIANAGVVIRDAANFEFATVPERVIALALFSLVLPLTLKWLLKKKKKPAPVYAREYHYSVNCHSEVRR